MFSKLLQVLSLTSLWPELPSAHFCHVRPLSPMHGERSTAAEAIGVVPPPSPTPKPPSWEGQEFSRQEPRGSHPAHKSTWNSSGEASPGLPRKLK